MIFIYFLRFKDFICLFIKAGDIIVHFDYYLSLYLDMLKHYDK